MINQILHKMVAFEQNEEQDTLICYVYIAFRNTPDHLEDPDHPQTGWYRHEFNKPEDIQDNKVSTGEQLEKEMRKQSKKYGVCDIMERFSKNLHPLDWEKVPQLPSFARGDIMTKSTARKTMPKKPKSPRKKKY